jgi:hypothetical protein
MDRRRKTVVALAAPVAIVLGLFATTGAVSPEEFPEEPQCSTFYNDEVTYVNNPEPVKYHSSYNGPIMYDPEKMSVMQGVSDFEVTGTPHDDWQDEWVPKQFHTECGVGSHMMGGSHH